MAFEPGQTGNPNGQPKWVKPWREAIRRAIARREETDPHALERLADRLIQKVDEGDVSAIKEFGDRIDGKVAQIIAGDDELPGVKQVHEIRHTIVDPQHSDSAGVQAAVETVPL
jgi:hypothetical protein